MGPSRYKESYYLAVPDYMWPYEATYRYKKFYYPLYYKVVPILGQYCSKIIGTGAAE